MQNPTCFSGTRLRFVATTLLATLSGIGAAMAQSTTPALAGPQLLPYTVKTVAGGGTSAIASGATCPVSGYTSTDAYGDGCLATEVLLGTGAGAPGARAAVADSQGNVFFGDYVNGVVHRVDAVTGIMTAIAGVPATSPAAGTACGTGISLDVKGDGCNSTLVHLSHPAGLVFATVTTGTGAAAVTTTTDLYIADYGYAEIRKIAATNGVIPATGGTITLIAGTAASTFGYNISNATTTVIAATQSVLDGPFGMAIDNQGDLIFSDEYNAAALAINLNATTTTTVGEVTLLPGTIWKIAGTVSSGGPYCVNSTGSSAGCTYNHVYTDNTPANSDYLRNAYGIAVDPSGNVYITDEYYDGIQKVATTGTNNLTTFAGINGTAGKTVARGQAGTIAIGSPFGVAADLIGNVYFSDAADGTVWRVDGATSSQYVIGSGFGSSGTGFASTTLPGPGIYNISVDLNANVLYGDTEKNIVGEIASGAQFGAVGGNQPAQTLDIHFGANDSPAASAYTLTSGTTNFSLGSATCTQNSDKTIDCLLPVTATPTVLGLFTANLQVKSTLGATSTFLLSGTYVQSPVTRTAVTYTSSAVCSGTTFATTTPITLSASLVANGPSAPTGTITFFASGTAIGAAQKVVNIGTTTSPVYGATLSTTFATAGTYAITATYSGDSYFKTSSGTASNTITTATPTFTTALTAYQTGTISAGQTALYSFLITQSVYSGTITFACSGQPAGTSCIFTPTSVTGTGCSTTNTVALSIYLQQGAVSAGALGLGGRWTFLTLPLVGLLALSLGLGRRKLAPAYLRLGMVFAALLVASSLTACGSGAITKPAATVSGTYPITVTSTGSDGTKSSFPITLTVK